jgi:hypothetical protein
MTTRLFLHEPASRDAGRPVLVMSQAPGPGLAQLDRVDLATSAGTCSCTVPARGAAECSCTAALTDADQAFLARVLAQLGQTRRTRPALSDLRYADPLGGARAPQGGDPQGQLSRLASQLAAEEGITLAEAYRAVALTEPALYHRARGAAYLSDQPRGVA